MRISDWSSDVCSSDLRPHASEARRPEAGSRAEGVSDGSPKGRDAAGDSMRSTTARPGRAFRPGDAHAAVKMPHGSPVSNNELRRLRGCRAGAAGAAGFEGCQAQRGGDGRTAFPWSASEARSAAGAKASAPGAAEKKRVAPKGNAPDACRDQCAVIACNCSITPGSTNTHGCLSAIGTLNTRANTSRFRSEEHTSELQSLMRI